jgi:hypothetical protein
VLGDGDSETDGSVLTVDPEAVRAFVAQAVDPPTSAPAGPSAAATVTVEVFNAASVAGLAKSVSEQLIRQGFIHGTVANSRPRAGSVVRFPTGGADAGRLVAAALGGLPIEEDADLGAGTVQVYLGKDYSGPGRRRIGGQSPGSVGTAHASGAARTIPDIAGGEDPSATASAIEPPPNPPPPRPTLVGGKVPCIS